MTAFDSKSKFAEALKSLASKKTMERITTEEVVKTAGLSRQTFYKFFTDKYDLAFWCYQRDIEPYYQQYQDGKISFRDMNRAMLQMMVEEKSFYRNVMDRYEVQNSFFQQYHKYSYETTLSYFGRTSTKMKAIIDLYNYGCNLMLMNWVTGGMKEDVDFMLDLFDEAMPECMKHIQE